VTVSSTRISGLKQLAQTYHTMQTATWTGLTVPLLIGQYTAQQSVQCKF